VTTTLRLSESTYTCCQCDITLDRDRGAARNLAALVGEVTGGTPSQTCGATITSPMETHVRPTPRGQQVPSRDDHKANAAPQGYGYPNRADTHPLKCQVTALAIGI
jgi:hypothetical protein